MAYPTPVVEIAFNDGPYVLSPTWTDVTTSVRSMSIDRGRSDDWGTFSGSAQVVLNNRARLFDPFYTSGTYYGKLLPRRQIRIRATYSSTTYDVFRGYISGWPPSWTDAGGDSTVTLSCFDAMQLLGSVQGPADWAREYILSLSPAHYYQLNEPITPYLTGQTLADQGSRSQALTTTNLAQSGPELASGLAQSSLDGFFNGNYIATAGSNVGTNYMTSASMTFMFWFDHTNGTDSSNMVLEGGFNDWWYTAENINTDANPNQIVFTFGNQSDTYQMGATLNDMSFQPHHVAMSINTASSNALRIWVDGIEVTGTRTRTSGYVLRAPEYLYVANGPISQVVVCSGVLTETQIREVVKYSTVALKETTSARVTRLIGQTPFSSSLVSTPASPSANVLDITDNAPFIAPELQLVANTEGGPLFVAKDGTLTMYKSNQIFTQTRSTTSQATYGSGGLGLGESVELYYDGDSVRNVVNTQMSQGGVIAATDSTSVSTYGTASMDNQTQAATIADANVSMNIIKALGATPYPKTTPVEVVLSPSANWSSTLGLELNDRITVNIAPPTGNTVSLPMLVQHIQHQVEPGRWQTFLEGSNRWAQSYSG